MANRDAGVGTHNCRFPRRRRAVHPNLSLSPRPVPNLAAVEELLVDVLAAGLAYLLQLLVVRLIRQILPAQ